MQRSKPNQAESAHMGDVQDLGCIVCREVFDIYSPALVHHCDTGMGRKRDHYKTIPLCPAHHDYTSPVGIHAMGKNAWEEKFNTEQHYLNVVAVLLDDPIAAETEGPSREL